ncbi:MAG: magnesium/cobalt transporter CorA [Candidatus Gracilibacteria bacterium]
MPVKKQRARAGRARVGRVRAERSQKNLISVIDYSEKHLEEKTFRDLNECIRYKNTPEVTWINIDNVPPLDFLKELGLGFDLHPVILDDITNPNQRPKVEITDDYIYIVLKMLTPDKKDGGKSGVAVAGGNGGSAGGAGGSASEFSFLSEQVSIVLASKFVITLQQGVRGDAFDYARSLIRKEKSSIRREGTDYLVYELISDIITNYFKVLEDFGDGVEVLERELMKNPSPQTLRSIYHLKQEVLGIRKAVWPLREVVDILERGDSPLIKKGTRIYLRDIYNRVTQVIDILETYRDTVSGMLDIYLSSVSNRLNSVMKVLTIITTIFMPLSFLAGLYGMNFRYMPGLGAPWGFFVMFGLMMLVALLMISFARKKRWL